MAARIKDRVRDFKKMFKENWKLFKQSKLGLIGLGIIIFFVLIAVLAPVIPYAADRDPVNWKCPVEDRVQPEMEWESKFYIKDYATNKLYNVSIFSDPNGLLSDGHDLRSFVEAGKPPNSYLEAIYLSIGNPQEKTVFSRGIVDVSPINGNRINAKSGKNLDGAIPFDFGPVYSSVSIYRDKTQNRTSGAPIDSVIVATSAKGNVLAVDVHGDPPSNGLNANLYTLSYTERWMKRIGNENISSSASIYYGNYTAKDDKIIVAGDKGTVVAYYLNGTQVWKDKLNGSKFFSPISVDVSDMVIVASRDGNFYALDVNNGSEMWHAHTNHTITTVYMSYYYKNTYDENATVFAGTDDGNIIGLHIYENISSVGGKENVESPRSASVYLTYQLPGYMKSIGDIYITPDNPNTASMYFGAYGNTGEDNVTTLYSLRVSTLVSGYSTGEWKDNEIIKWKQEISNATIHARPIYDPKSQYVSFALDNGEVVTLDQAGQFIIKETTKPGAKQNAPLFATSIPGIPANVPSFVFATTKDGYMFMFSGTGKTMTPLPPGTYKSGLYYPLGTDAYGRDIFSQLIWGSRIALLVGFAASFLSVLIGVIVGIVAGYSGGWVDVVLMRFTDVVLVLPFLPLIIVLAAVMGPSIWNIILAITLVGWPGTARIIRSQVLSLKERPFIDAARVTGASNTRIMFRHIMPNVLPLAFLFMTFAVTGAILGEASLSFIGLGDPNSMSWGMMLYYVNHGYTLTAWWWMLPPGLAITFLVLGFFLVGRAFEEIINPRLRRRR